MLAKWPPKDELKEGWPEGTGQCRAPSLRQEELRMPSRHPRVLMTWYHRYINQLSVSAGDCDLLQGTGMASFTSELSET